MKLETPPPKGLDSTQFPKCPTFAPRFPGAALRVSRRDFGGMCGMGRGTRRVSGVTLRSAPRVRGVLLRQGHLGSSYVFLKRPLRATSQGLGFESARETYIFGISIKNSVG